MATAHLIFGSVGSGKTTYAKGLERDRGAVRFTPDEWMARLFGDDPPAATFEDRMIAILDLMQPVWTRCLTLGVDVVLDFGFWRRSERDAARDLARRIGATAVLYEVSCPAGEIRARIERRNSLPDKTLFIAPGTVDALDARVEPLESDEDRVRVSTR